MTVDLINKWAELFEFSYYSDMPTCHTKSLKFNKLSQAEKEAIFYEFINDEIIRGGLMQGNTALKHIAYIFKYFAKKSGLTTKSPNLNFDYLLNIHHYNIRGIVTYLVYAVLYNWRDLFIMLVDEINNFVIPEINKQARPGYELSFKSFTVDEVKELVKFIAFKLNKEPNFLEIYKEAIEPYCLN